MAEDVEIEVMQMVAKALEPLEEQARRRVIGWLAQRYGVIEPIRGNRSPETSENTVEQKSRTRKRMLRTPSPSAQNDAIPRASVREIVNLVRSGEEAKMIEVRILDERNQSNRVLLPLYIVQKHLNDSYAMSALEIAEVCRQLNVPIKPENVSKMLRGPAAKFVTLESDGNPKRFKIIRRGFQHIAETLSAKLDNVAVDLRNETVGSNSTQQP